jgi:NADH dehydrogenase FAD-containing subunit
VRAFPVVVEDAQGRGHLRRVFARLGVEIRDGARVTEVRAGGLLLAGGEHVPADTVVSAVRSRGLARSGRLLLALRAPGFLGVPCALMAGWLP